MAKEKGKGKDNEKLGCLMVDMPKEIDNVIRKFVSDNINDKEKLYYSDKFDYVQGIPENFHVTVKYGLYEINDSGIKKLYKPIKLKLGKIDKFRNDDYDVLIVKIESEDLMELNKEICEGFENKTTFEYSPHLTLAYVTKGSYDNLVGKSISDSNNIITLGVDKYIYKPYKNDKGVNAMAHMTPEELDKWEKEYDKNKVEEAKEALQKGGYLITPKNIKTVIKYWAKGYAHATMPWDLLDNTVNANVNARTSDIGRKALLSDGNVGEVVKIYKTFVTGPNPGKDIPKYEYDMLVNGETKRYPQSQLEEWLSASEEAKDSIPKYNVGETVKVVKGENEGKEGEVLEVVIYTEDEGWKSNMIVPYVYFINFEGANKDNPNDWIMEEDIMGVNKVEGKVDKLGIWRSNERFDEEYQLDDIDFSIRATLEMFGIKNGDKVITSTFVKMGDGDFDEVWVTDDGAPYQLGTEYVLVYTGDALAAQKIIYDIYGEDSFKDNAEGIEASEDKMGEIKTKETFYERVNEIVDVFTNSFDTVEDEEIAELFNVNVNEVDELLTKYYMGRDEVYDKTRPDGQAPTTAEEIKNEYDMIEAMLYDFAEKNINRKGIWASKIEASEYSKLRLNDHVVIDGKEYMVYMVMDIAEDNILLQGFGTEEEINMPIEEFYKKIGKGDIIMASEKVEVDEFGVVDVKDIRNWLKGNGVNFTHVYLEGADWINGAVALTEYSEDMKGWYVLPMDDEGIEIVEVLGINEEDNTYNFGVTKQFNDKNKALGFINNNVIRKKVKSAKQSEQKFERNDVVEIVNGEHEGSVGIIEDAEYDENYWRDAGGEWVYTIENAENEELIEGVAESDLKMTESGKGIESSERIPIEIRVYFEDSNKLNAIGKEFADSMLNYGAWVNVDISGEGGMSIEDAENMISWDAEVYDINYNNYQPNLQTEQDYVGDNVMDLIYTYYSSWFGLSTNKIKNIEVIFKGKVPGYDSSEQIKSKTKVKAEGNNENDNETVEVSNDEILEQFRKENTHKFRVYEDIRSGNEAPISILKEVIQKGIEALDNYAMDNAGEYVGDIAYDTVDNWLKEEGYTEVEDDVKDEMRWHIEELADYNIEDLFDYPVLLKKYYGEIYHEEGVVLSYDNVVWTDEANKWKAEALKYISQKDLESICNNSTYGGDAFVGGIVSGKEIIETIMKGEKEVQVDTIIVGIHDSANGSGFYEEGNGKLKINFDEAKLDVGSYSLGAVFGTGEWIYASRTKPNTHKLKVPVETLLKKRGVDFEVIDINQVTEDKVWVDVYYKDKEDYDMMVIERSQLNDNEVKASKYPFRVYHDGTPQEYREYKLPYKFNTIEELIEIAKGNEELMEFLQGEMSTGDVILSNNGKEFVGIDIQDALKKIK